MFEQPVFLSDLEPGSQEPEEHQVVSPLAAFPSQQRSQEEISEEWELIDLLDDEETADSAFETIWRTNYDAIRAYVYKQTRNHDVTDDITQTAFMRFYETRHRYTQRGAAKVSSLLVAIARNALYDHRKSAAQRLTDSSDDLEGEGGSVLFAREAVALEDLALAALDTAILREAVLKLPEDQRTCVMLRDFLEYSSAEATRAIGKSASTVNRRRTHAHKNLADILMQRIMPIE